VPSYTVARMHRLLLLLVAVTLVLGCSSDDGEADPPACREAEEGRLTLVADDVQWDTDCLRAPAGPLTIEVDNRDDGMNHNLHLPSAPGSPATDLVAGPSTSELDVDLELGTYEYVCDIHPNMVGTLNVVGTNP
jgi:plastocyanin